MTKVTIGRRALLALGAAALAARPAAAKAALPDFSGTWTNAWYTYLERPRAFKALVATSAEAEAYEAPRRALKGEIDDPHDELGQATSEFPDNGPGLARIRGEIRTSWIVDPPDGKVPWSAAGRARVKPGEDPETYDNVEERPTDERCLTATGVAAPLINSHDTNVLQIVQTRDAVVFVAEKNHDTRIVPILRPGQTAPPHGPAPGNWQGVSVGRWERATLVVETTALRPGLTKVNDSLTLSDRARVVERFTRTGPNEILCVFDVTDPALFTRPWRGEMVFRPSEGLIYEFACHEGNYSLPSILAAARLKEQAAR